MASACHAALPKLSPRARARVVIVFALCAGANALAADWKVRPKLNVSERFSDNINLSAEDPKSGFTTKITPGLRLFREGGRVTADINYELENFFRHSGGDNSLGNNKLRANLNAELIDPWFYLDASAFMQRSAASLLDFAGVDESTSGRFADITSVSLTPRARYRYRNLWSAEASLRTSHVSSSAALSDSLGNELRIGADSGTAFNKVGWSLDYFAERIDYSSAQAEVNSQKFDAGVSYRVRPRLRLLANAGYESFDSESLTEDQDGASWSLGAAWQPTNRTVLQATAGRRFFGNSYGLSFSHRTRRTTWSLGYNEAVTTSRSQLDLAGDIRSQLDVFLQREFPDALERARLIDNFLDQIADQSIIFSNQVFLQKRLQGSIIWDLTKHTFVLSGFTSSRDVDAVGGRRSLILGNNDFNISRFIRESGTSATWSWQFMPKTSAVSTLTTNLTEFTDIDREDRDLLLSFGVLRQLSRYAAGSLEFRHQRRDSNSRSGLDFDENSLEAGLQITY